MALLSVMSEGCLAVRSETSDSLGHSAAGGLQACGCGVRSPPHSPPLRDRVTNVPPARAPSCRLQALPEPPEVSVV